MIVVHCNSQGFRMRNHVFLETSFLRRVPQRLATTCIRKLPLRFFTNTMHLRLPDDTGLAEVENSHFR